jgi:hypothetical protein
MRRPHGSEGAGAQQCAPATRLGDDHVGGGDPDPGDLIELFHRSGERGDQLLDPGLDRGDVGAGLVDSGEHGAQQERVVVGEVPDKRLFQHRDLGAHPGSGQLGERLGVAFPGQQRGQHLPPGDPEDVAGDHRQLDLGVLEQLLHPVLLRGARVHQVGPVAGQVAQLPDLDRRDEAGAQHLPFGDLGQPHRVELVGLGPPGQVLDVFGVDQPRVELLGLQDVEDRFPVIRRRFHHHPGHPQLPEPISQPQQRTGHRRVRRDLLRAAAGSVRVRHPDAGHQLGLADVQRRDPLDDLFGVLAVVQHRYPPHVATTGGHPQELQGSGESNPRARSNTKGPTTQLPAPD